jgi:hypothetical protein
MGDIPRSVELKFSRVGEHMVALDAAIKTFLSTEPYGARRVVERDGLEHIFYWTSYEPCPDRFGLIAGDAIHNLRSSLDHMVVALAIEGAKSSGKHLGWDDLNSLQFPIVNKTLAFNEQVTRGRLRDVNAGATALIESVQPYNSKDPGAPKRSLLAMLSYLDNSDKHRILTTSAMAPIAEKVLWDPEASEARLEHPEDLRTEVDAEIGRFIFSSPRREEEVNVTFAWRFVLMQGPMWSLFDIRDIIRSYDQEVRAIVWKLSCEFMPPFGATPTPLDDSIDI